MSESKLPQGLMDHLLGNTEIQTSRKKHVSGETGGTVNKQGGHAASGSRPSSSRSARGDT